MLSIEDVAKLTNISIKLVRREIASGDLKSSKINNKIIINEKDFEDWKGFKNFETLKQIKNKSKIVDIVNWVDISNEMETVDGWNNKNDITNFNFIDLFSGAGGLSCGLVMDGFNPVGTVEILESAVKTYKRNFIDYKGFDEFVETRDIREDYVKKDLINSVKNKHIHLIAGGFPCQ